MKLPRITHSWNLTPAAAIRVQQRLADQVRPSPLMKPARFVAGGDVSFLPDGETLVAGWVVWDVKRGAVVETVTARRPVTFPYIPGLLSFREAPALIAAARKLRIEPDVFMLDGQGLAHPRRFGIACHLGVLIDRPTLGCAKSRLCGTHDTPTDAVGAAKPIVLDGETVGRVVRMRPGVKPVYVSIGHRLSLQDAVQTVLRCGAGLRQPEPTRRAHQLVTAERNQIAAERP